MLHMQDIRTGLINKFYHVIYKMTTTHKFRLCPKKIEQEKLEIALETCRQTYNNLLSELKCSKEMPRDYNSAKVILVRGKELASMEKASNTEQFVQQEASMNSESIILK